MLLGLVVAATSASAQATVSATSGDPAAIARIRAVFDSVERSPSRLRQTAHDLHGFSLEGGALRGFFDGNVLRKLTVRNYGESGRSTQEFYFADGQPVFIFDVEERYDRPMSGRVRLRVEHRLYLAAGQLIRRIRTLIPASGPEAAAPPDPDLAEFLASLKVLVACASAVGADPPACTSR